MQYKSYQTFYKLDKDFYECEWDIKYFFSIYNAILQLCGNDI